MLVTTLEAANRGIAHTARFALTRKVRGPVALSVAQTTSTPDGLSSRRAAVPGRCHGPAWCCSMRSASFRTRLCSPSGQVRTAPSEALRACPDRLAKKCSPAHADTLSYSAPWGAREHKVGHTG